MRPIFLTVLPILSLQRPDRTLTKIHTMSNWPTATMHTQDALLQPHYHGEKSGNSHTKITLSPNVQRESSLHITTDVSQQIRFRVRQKGGLISLPRPMPKPSHIADEFNSHRGTYHIRLYSEWTFETPHHANNMPINVPTAQITSFSKVSKPRAKNSTRINANPHPKVNQEDTPLKHNSTDQEPCNRHLRVVTQARGRNHAKTTHTIQYSNHLLPHIRNSVNS